MSLSKSEHEPIKGTAWDSISSLSHSATILVFTAIITGTSHLGIGTLGWRAFCGVGTLHSSGVVSAAEILLLIFIHMWSPPVL